MKASFWIPMLFAVEFFLPLPFAMAQSPDLARLEPVSGVTRDDLQGVTSVVVSSDGKFLYATSWRANAVVGFRIEKQDLLSHIQTVADPDLGGAADIVLSPDGNYAAVAAFRSSALVLFRRDPDSGELTFSAVAKQDLGWAVDLAFSPEGRFIYVADAGGSGNSGATRGAVVALRVNRDGSLQHVQRIEQSEFAGARGVIAGPEGKSIYLTCSTAGTMAVFDRNSDDGTIKLGQLIRDGQANVTGLQGVMTAAISPDGKHLYTVSGRFLGDHAVSVFRRKAQGRVVLVQELQSGPGGLGDFRGGNRIVVTPGGAGVYATGTTPGSLACLRRDPNTGRLHHVSTLTVEDSPRSLQGAVGIAFSPSSDLLFIAAETANEITALARTGVGDAR